MRDEHDDESGSIAITTSKIDDTRRIKTTCLCGSEKKIGMRKRFLSRQMVKVLSLLFIASSIGSRR